ncbi:hypothetical protein D3C85_422340 [compost metagenome]
MESNQTRCYRCVGDTRKMRKSGKRKSGNQRYIWMVCGKTRVENYTYMAYKGDINQNIIQLTKEGSGIRSTARILKYQPQAVPCSPKNVPYEKLRKRL